MIEQERRTVEAVESLSFMFYIGVDHRSREDVTVHRGVSWLAMPIGQSRV